MKVLGSKFPNFFILIFNPAVFKRECKEASVHYLHHKANQSHVPFQIWIIVWISICNHAAEILMVQPIQQIMVQLLAMVCLHEVSSLVLRPCKLERKSNPISWSSVTLWWFQLTHVVDMIMCLMYPLQEIEPHTIENFFDVTDAQWTASNESGYILFYQSRE